MLEISDVVDRESLKRWLDDYIEKSDKEALQSQLIWLSSRVAGKAAPLAWAKFHDLPSGPGIEVSGLLALRPLAVLVVCGLVNSSSLNSVMLAAERKSSAIEAARRGHLAFRSIVVACRTKVNPPKFISSIVATSAWTIPANQEAAHQIYSSLQSDLERIVSGRWNSYEPLWLDENPFALEWSELKQRIGHRLGGSQVDPNGHHREDWSFWITWYDRLLEGKDIYAQELHDILITLTDEDWDKGAAHINPKFDSVLALYRRSDSYIGERIKRDEDGQFEREEVAHPPEVLLRNAVSKVEDAISNLIEAASTYTGNHMLFQAAIVARDLQDVLARYPDDFLRLHDEFLESCCDLDRDFSKAEISQERMLNRLYRALDTGALDMRENDEDTKRACKTRVNSRALNLDDEVKTQLRKVQEEASAESQPALAAEMEADLETGLDESNSDETRANAMKREGSRLIRMDVIKRQEVVKAAEDANKVVKGGSAAWSVIREVWSWFV